MIKIINCKNKNYLRQLQTILNSRWSIKNNKSKIVSKIIKDIKKNGIKALLKYEKRFSQNKSIKCSSKEINKAIRKLDPKVKKALDFSYNQVLKFHKLQLKSIKNISYRDKYKKLELNTVPIDSLGIYTPYGLPTSLLMTAIPAKLAKVKKIILATPKINGQLSPGIMYVAKKVGIKEILNCGGAQAIAGLVYIKKVSKILGPGNEYVAEAKKQLSGICGFEQAYCGPSEICIIADKNTDIYQVATSICGQSEHGKNSSSTLITKDEIVIKKVIEEIPKVLKDLPRKSIASKSIKNHCIMIKAKNDRDIINCCDLISPEHLEILVKNYNKYVKHVTNVGSIVNGKYTAMVAADMGCLGVNHVLPTNFSSRYSSGLNINEYIKRVSVATLSKIGLEKIVDHGSHIAKYEKLMGHYLSLQSRLRRRT